MLWADGKRSKWLTGEFWLISKLSQIRVVLAGFGKLDRVGDEENGEDQPRTTLVVR